MKKRKILLLSMTCILVMVLSACNGTYNQADSTTSATGTNGVGSTSLTQVNMLLVGTLKLEDTDQAVSADEATQLLPLWQAYRSLSTSQTAAEAEVEALLNQIQSTMTADQVKAIQAMNLTSTDMMDLMESMGGMRPQGTPNPQSTPGFNIPSGGFPSGNPPSGSAGGPPSGSTGGMTRNFPSGGAPPSVVIIGGDAGSAAGLGGGPMTQGTQDPSMQATAQARFSTQASQVNTILLDVLITKLEARTTN